LTGVLDIVLLIENQMFSSRVAVLFVDNESIMSQRSGRPTLFWLIFNRVGLPDLYS